MIRTGLAAMITGNDDLLQVGESGNGLEAVQLIPALPTVRFHTNSILGKLAVDNRT